MLLSVSKMWFLSLSLSKTNLKSVIKRHTKEHHRLVLERGRLNKCMSETLSSNDPYICHNSKLYNIVIPYFVMTFLNFLLTVYKLSKTVLLTL